MVLFCFQMSLGWQRQQAYTIASHLESKGTEHGFSLLPFYHKNHLGGPCYSAESDSLDLERTLRFHISNKIPGGANTTGYNPHIE